MINYSDFKPISIEEIRKQSSKTMYRSICVPSAVQSYSLCIEYIKQWFLSKFDKNMFKSIYVDGKNIYDDFRSLSRLELLKRQKPALAIYPSINWDFDNEKVDSYPYGLELYTQVGKFKESFFSCPETSSYLGMAFETLLMPFSIRVRVETRAQQLDLYKYMKLACRVGYTCGENIDLDFHIPYQLMIQLAKDNGFETIIEDEKERIINVSSFLRWLNMHSQIPFLYKHRALNGENEFFIRIRDAYAHIRPMDLSADDGERESQLSNNFGIELNLEVRFPAPRMYAYYSDNEHKLTEVYGAWYQPNGPISTCYTFKGTTIPDKNEYGWPLFMSTTYEDDLDSINTKISIDLSSLLEGDIGECIHDCLEKGISPSIFCDLIFYNGGEYIHGSFDWENITFNSDVIVRSAGTYIGVYIDNDYLSDFILSKSGYENRLQKSEK